MFNAQFSSEPRYLNIENWSLNIENFKNGNANYKHTAYI